MIWLLLTLGLIEFWMVYRAMAGHPIRGGLRFGG